MGEQRTRQGRQHESPLQSERGATTIGDAVVAKIVGIAAQEVEGVQTGGGTARAMGGVLDRVPGAVSGVGGGSQKLEHPRFLNRQHRLPVCEGCVMSRTPGTVDLPTRRTLG
jgi:hypothetical protein